MEKVSQDLRALCEEEVNLIDAGKCFLLVAAAKAMIQQLSSKPVKARQSNRGLQLFGLYIEGSQHPFGF